MSVEPYFGAEVANHFARLDRITPDGPPADRNTYFLNINITLFSDYVIQRNAADLIRLVGRRLGTLVLACKTSFSD